MELQDAFVFLAEKEKDGTLTEFIQEHYPEYILPDGTVAKFEIIADLESGKLSLEVFTDD